MNLGSKVGKKPAVVRKTEKLGERERERKALFPSEGKEQDDDDEHYNNTIYIIKAVRSVSRQGHRQPRNHS